MNHENPPPPNKTNLVVAAAFQDAGDATRAIHLASALRKNCPPNHSLTITFLCNGSHLEPLISQAGFPIVHCSPQTAGISAADDLGWDFPEIFGSKELAQSFIEGQLAALKELAPDVVLHGMWAPASLAARMLGIGTISFLPLPVCVEAFGGGMVKDIPDMVPVLARLPRWVRQWIAWVGSGLMPKSPALRQHRLGAAAAACGWGNVGPISLFDMAKADLNLVNDLPEFHRAYADKLPGNIVICGPLFSKTTGQKLDPELVAHLENGDGSAKKVLVTMGSSGTPELLMEVIRALTLDPLDNWRAVVLAPRSICSLSEALAVAENDARILITDKFVPAPAAHALVDVSIIHGGQGTVQTAMSTGTPVVGVALQIEQQTNLDHVMDAGAGIRIQMFDWRAEVIRKAVNNVLAEPEYAAAAKVLAAKMERIDGEKIASDAMWKFILGDRL